MKIVNLKDTLNKLYYVGGIVRDEILGIESLDIDLTYEGNAIEYAQTLENIVIEKINEPFGTVRVKYLDNEIDIASTRKESYPLNGHLPVVTDIGCSLKDDVLRRDFTVNALAKNFNTGEIVDFVGGLDDIQAKQLRVLHDKSFIEDPTRILRALKFSIRFNFKLEEHTKNLQKEYLQNINYDMSFKRVKKELIETFNLNSQKAYDKFIDEGIYKLVTSKDVKKTTINIENLINKYIDFINKSNIWLIYTGTLEDLSNLELTKEEQKILDDFSGIKNLMPETDYEIYKTFNGVKPETVLLYAILKDYNTASRYLDKLINIKPEISGKTLQALGIEPSAKYQKCFDKILEEKLAKPTLTLDDEIKIAKNFFGI